MRLRGRLVGEVQLLIAFAEAPLGTCQVPPPLAAPTTPLLRTDHTMFVSASGLKAGGQDMTAGFRSAGLPPLGAWNLKKVMKALIRLVLLQTVAASPSDTGFVITSLAGSLTQTLSIAKMNNNADCKVFCSSRWLNTARKDFRCVKPGQTCR